jgi:hypothetical protein
LNLHLVQKQSAQLVQKQSAQLVQKQSLVNAAGKGNFGEVQSLLDLLITARL